MARPLPRRRAARDEAPDADDYASTTSRRTSKNKPDDVDEERRPSRSRGRGELPSRGRKAAEPDMPESKRALGKLEDDEFDALLKHFGLDEDATEADLWEAIEDRGAEPDEEPEEAPRRGRGRTREEPEDEPEPPRRGRGRRSESDEDDEPPARGRGRASRDDEPAARERGRSTGRSKDDDEDDEPRTARRGFEGFKKTRTETGSFDDFKLNADQQLGKFLEDEPFATYGEHGLYKELSKGQRVWVCLKPKDCPISDLGFKARPVALWNFLVMPEEGDPKVVVLKAGPLLEKAIEAKSALKTGPMSKEYYALSQTEGENDGPPVYSVEVVRERDLEEDWQEKPFTDRELAEYRETMFDESYVVFPKVSDLREVAKQLRNRD